MKKKTTKQKNRKRYEKAIHRRGNMNGQKTHKKMLNLPGNQGNAN